MNLRQIPVWLISPSRLIAVRGWLCMSCLLITLIPAGASGLDSVEKIILRHAGEQRDQAIQILERAVNINSETMNFEGIKEVGRVFQKEFESLGFETRWLDGASFGRAGHLWAERLGRGPRILLIGHLDTVFELHSPFQRFDRLEEQSARGPWTVDMKGGNVVIVQALRALEYAQVLDNLSLRVVFTGDEEKSGRPLSLAPGTQPMPGTVERFRAGSVFPMK